MVSCVGHQLAADAPALCATSTAARWRVALSRVPGRFAVSFRNMPCWQQALGEVYRIMVDGEMKDFTQNHFSMPAWGSPLGCG
jgi:hypothetical protein